MAFRVLLIEDKPDLRGLIREHLDEAFSQSVNHGWPEDWPKNPEKHLIIEVLDEANLKALVKTKRRQTIRNRFARLDEEPHVIITDLALSNPEVKRLDKHGGPEVTGAKDPSKQLAQTTGFQILEAMATTMPVIATTYASNPVVIDACWKAGAHAVIPKPATDEQMSAFYAHWKKGLNNPHYGLTRSQKEKAERWGRRIDSYLSTVTNEVIKAVRAQALSQMESVVPRHLPYWLALDRERLDGRRIKGTSLMLVEVEGLSTLANLGIVDPKSSFELINEVWDQIQPLLKASGAEINHFAGDAALIYRGVYDDDDGHPCQLGDTLRCGAEISRLFELRGEVRTKLQDVIKERYSSRPEREIKGMEDHVGGTNFDVRVISIEPPEDGALYGRLGASSRWQHSALTGYFNVLKAAKAQLDLSRKQLSESSPSEALTLGQGGESFLIYDAHGQRPAVSGFAIQSLRDLLDRPPDNDFPELAGLEVHRVLPEPDTEAVR